MSLGLDGTIALCANCSHISRSRAFLGNAHRFRKTTGGTCSKCFLSWEPRLIRESTLPGADVGTSAIGISQSVRYKLRTTLLRGRSINDIFNLPGTLQNVPQAMHAVGAVLYRIQGDNSTVGADPEGLNGRFIFGLRGRPSWSAFSLDDELLITPTSQK